MRRRFLLIVLALALGFLVILATAPFWLGHAVQLAGRSRGLTFKSYERMGYSRFAFRDAEFRMANVRVTVARAEADTPLLWAWRHWQKNDAAIVAGDWRVEVDASSKPSDPNAPRGWVVLRRQLQRIAAQLNLWLPRASVGAGSVHWPGGEIGLAKAKWANGALAAEGIDYHALKADATVTFAADDLVKVAARFQDGTAEARLESRGSRVNGDVMGWDQPATLDANFAERGWLPAEASLKALNWTLPGSRLKLGEVYSAVRGSAHIEWSAGRFVTDITAASDPLPGKSAPPLEIALRGRGDMESFTVESVNAALPGVTAKLSEPITIERSGRMRESGATFALAADLAKLPWVVATGTVTGKANLVSSLAAAPVVEFSITAKEVTAREVALSAVDARGRLEWPRLEIVEGVIVGGDGERLAWRGGWDFGRKELFGGKVDGQIRRQSVARWLPKQPEFDVVNINVDAAGAMAAFQHHGQLTAENVKFGAVHPLRTVAAWRGHGAAIDDFTMEAVAAGSKVTAAGRADTTSLTLTALDFVQGDAPRLRLTEPATLRWQPALQLATLRLAGPEGKLTVAATAGPTGRIEMSAAKIPSHWFNDFVAPAGPAWAIEELALSGDWDRGPMTFALKGEATVEIGSGRSAAINIVTRGNKEGIQIEALRATEIEAMVVNATGRLPITFRPGGGELMTIDLEGPIVFDASAAPNAAFWQKLAALSGVELKDPEATAHLTGTWQRPEGTAGLKAAQIAIDAKRVSRPLPTVDALDIQIKGDRGGVTLTKFEVSVEGQAVRAQGRLPVPDGSWPELFKEPLAIARRGADLRLEIPDAEVAVFLRFLPAVLAPKGRLQVDVTYKNGGLQGFAHLRDAASRPLGPLGVLQEITADLVVSGRTLVLQGVTAKSGGQPVTLSGKVDLPENGAPRFDLALRGDNLPFVRQTGLLLRGDLDLKLQTPADAPPRLSGNVRLRDSLFLSDVRSFLPKGGASASRRPPYFAIETPPVSGWGLAVDVSGQKFVRLRTPVFTGVASAHFRLGGTLGEPRAIGEITLDEGSIRMPFASFAVTQGSVRLTEADPFEPEIYVRGTGRRYSYNLTLEVDGRAAQPNLVITSSPALESEQVLLMVMTGAAPSNEISNSAGQRVANIGLFLGQSLLGSLGTDVADADRLSLATGEKISRQGKETYDIEYRLSDRWTLTAEYNEFDEKNAGVKWRAFRGERAGDKERAADEKK